MDLLDTSFDYSFSEDSPTDLNQGFLLNPDNTIDSNIIPDTPSFQASKRRRSDREEHLNPESVSSSSSEELCFIGEQRSISVYSPSATTSPEESYLSAASLSSSVVELDTQVVDPPGASPEAGRRWCESLTMSAASLASPSPASLQADFLFSLTDMERRQLCGGREEDLAGEEEPLGFSNHWLYWYLDMRGGNSVLSTTTAVTEILDSSHARLEQEREDEEFARYLQTQFDAEQASSLQQQRPHRYPRSVHHSRRQRAPQNGWEGIGGLGGFLSSPDPLEGDYEALLQFEEQQGAVVARQLSTRDISRFPTKKFQSGACAGSTGCNICLCDYADGETLRTLPCLHSYHKDCIDHWLRNKPICPVCRTDLSDSDSLDTQHS